MSLVIEFAVQMRCKSCADKIETNLKNTNGVANVEVILDKNLVLVETTLPFSLIKEKIESSGFVAVLNGYGNKIGNTSLEKSISTEQTVPATGSAAVAMLGGPVGFSTSNVHGVIRFIQTHDACVIDGTVDGLTPGLHGLHIHECGDISNGCESVGDHFDLNGTSKHGAPDGGNNNRHTGDLGNIEADDNGRAIFRLNDRLIKVWDIIGRSVVVTECEDDLGKGGHPKSLVDGNSGNRLACGIISRSAGLFENTKKICACDGVTIWDERNKPLAGPGRREVNNVTSANKTCAAV